MTATDGDRLARAALSVLGEPGEHRVLSLVDDLGPELVLDLLRTEESTAARYRGLEPERVLERATRAGVRFVTPADGEWPRQLDDLAAVPALQERGGVPVGLWVRGPLPLDEVGGAVSVVGSRSATTYGADVAAEIAATVSGAGRAVVSGAAFGIDQAAHRGALAGEAPTVAVLACGADRVYPAAHQRLIDHIAATGAVVSETPPGGSPMRIRFLARNRLIAGLAVGTVVVEAAYRSGALNTANWASRLSRHLMGVPGPVTSAASQGVHQLIRSGAATLVTSGSDVLELVGAAGEHLVEEPRGPEGPRDRLSLRQRQVLDAVPVAVAAEVGSIARTAGLGPAEVQAALTELGGLGLVEADGTGWRLAVLAHE